MASSFLRFLDHTQRRITVGRTPLDEWSARRIDLYLTTHNIHNRQTSMTPVGFEPTISAGQRPQTYALDRADPRTGYSISQCLDNLNIDVPYSMLTSTKWCRSSANHSSCCKDTNLHFYTGTLLKELPAFFVFINVPNVPFLGNVDERHFFSALHADQSKASLLL